MKAREGFFVLRARGKVGGELVRYSAVGAIGFSLNLLLLYFLTEFLEVYYLVSSALASIVSGLTIFSLDKIWTFRESFKKNFFSESVFFFIFGIIGLFARLFLVYSFTEFLGIYYVVSQVFAILIVGVFTFTCNEIWTFTSNKKKRK